MFAVLMRCRPGSCGCGMWDVGIVKQVKLASPEEGGVELTALLGMIGVMCAHPSLMSEWERKARIARCVFNRQRLTSRRIS